MNVPKQIIYPMHYLRPLLPRGASAERRFIDRFAAFLDTDGGIVPLGRARAGLHLLAHQARRTGRDRVIMLPYTIPDVVNMVRFAGCEPVFVDMRPDSTQVDFDHLESLIDGRTCAVLLTHYHVNQDRMGEIAALCRQKDVVLFDDCALALGGSVPEGLIGTVTDASVFSMSGFKTVNYVWGGAVVSHDPAITEVLAARVAKFPRLTPLQYRKHMLPVMKYDIATRGVVFSRYTLPMLQRQAGREGGGSDVTTPERRESVSLDATILSRPSLGALDELTRKFDRVEAMLQHRRRIAAVYDTLLAERRVSGETPEAVGAGSCFVNYPVTVPAEKRDAIFRKLLDGGFHVGLSLYPNVHESEAFGHYPGSSRNVASLVRSMLCLPTHLRVDEAYAAELARALVQAL